MSRSDSCSWALEGLGVLGLLSTSCWGLLGHFQADRYRYRSLIWKVYLSCRSLIEALNTPNSPPVVSCNLGRFDCQFSVQDVFKILLWFQVNVGRYSETP